MPESNNAICIVAIIRDEEPFLDEWIFYHRILGIDYFYLYDDSPDLPLKNFLKPHENYITVVPWYNRHEHLPGRNRQTKAYTNFLQNYALHYERVAFIDVDEFIVLRKHENIKHFIHEYEMYGAISLNWHIFGHNGFFDDPKGLITSELTRRMYKPNANIKTISKCHAISSIESAHSCILKTGFTRVDANKQVFTKQIYDGKTDVAHINHYQCRSFVRWMNRVKRGDILEGTILPEHQWKVDEQLCLKQFVETVALNKNEYVDDYMLKWKPFLEQAIAGLKRSTFR